MRLLSSNFSPFSTRIRIQIRKKKLPINICTPDPALRSAEFLAKFNLGKIPILELGDGDYIAESWAIMEYLEARFPEVPLRPKKPREIANINMMCRFADLHLGPALFPIFLALLTGQEVDKEQQISAIRKELEKGDRLIASMPSLSNRSLDIGDIALACSLLFTVEVPKIFGCENILEGFDNLSQWWQSVLLDQEVKQGIDEMKQAFDAFMASQSATKG